MNMAKKIITFKLAIACKTTVIPTSVTRIGDGVFDWWESSQTINCQAPSRPSGWWSNWNSNCNATINWNVSM